MDFFYNRIQLKVYNQHIVLKVVKLPLNKPLPLTLTAEQSNQHSALTVVKQTIRIIDTNFHLFGVAVCAVQMHICQVASEPFF